MKKKRIKIEFKEGKINSSMIHPSESIYSFPHIILPWHVNMYRLSKFWDLYPSENMIFWYFNFCFLLPH